MSRYGQGLRLWFQRSMEADKRSFKWEPYALVGLIGFVATAPLLEEALT